MWLAQPHEHKKMKEKEKMNSDQACRGRVCRIVGPAVSSMFKSRTTVALRGGEKSKQTAAFGGGRKETSKENNMSTAVKGAE